MNAGSPASVGGVKEREKNRFTSSPCPFLSAHEAAGGGGPAHRLTFTRKE
jgi:hypothetical protein